MNISAMNLDFKELNTRIREAEEHVILEECFGQRFIGSGLKHKEITIHGTPGNALGSYLDGAKIYVNGNVQDAVGDTMNAGEIIVKGNAGDALGYAMRGGEIYIKGNSGYRTGIHMKQYEEKKPVIVIGGRTGSFLGEYLAGGIILVLGIDCDGVPAGNFTGTGMHGGKIILRSKKEPERLPQQVTLEVATEKDLEEIRIYIRRFADYFHMDTEDLLKGTFYVLRPNAKSPYKQLYTAN